MAVFFVYACVVVTSTYLIFMALKPVVWLLNTWLDIRKTTFGLVVVINKNDSRTFYPRTASAKTMLTKYTSDLKTGWSFFGGRTVSNENYYEVYEGIMHDPDMPQCMTTSCLLRGTGPRIRITDT